MKLYAIEHSNGWLYWTSDGWCELRGLRIGDGLWTDRLAAETFEADKHSGTVVTLHLTRTPELKVGARVVDVPEEAFGVVVELRDTIAQLKNDRGEYWWSDRSDLIVLPEEDA